MLPPIRAVVCAALALVLAACATYREHLHRGERLYHENQFEHALAIWRALEDDMDSLSFTEQARYAYLRGMTGFRLGFNADARHWLAIAKAVEKKHPGGLTADMSKRIEETLAELNREVYGGAEHVGRSEADPDGPVTAEGDEGLLD